MQLFSCCRLGFEGKLPCSKWPLTTTTRTYNSAQQSYIKFYNQFDLIPLLASERALLRYIAHMSYSVKGSSLNVYISAIKSLHIMNDYDDTGFASSVSKALASKLRGPGFKSRPGTVVTIIMWGARPVWKLALS